MVGLGSLARKIFGSANDRRVKGYRPKVAQINALEAELSQLSDDELRARTAQFKQEAVHIRDDYENMLRAIIDDGIRDGSFGNTNTVATTRCVLSMLNWMSRWFKPGAGATAEDIALEYYQLLMKGLEPRSQG